MSQLEKKYNYIINLLCSKYRCGLKINHEQCILSFNTEFRPDSECSLSKAGHVLLINFVK